MTLEEKIELIRRTRGRNFKASSELERMVESIEGVNGKVSITLTGQMTQEEVYKALMNVTLKNCELS